MCENRSNNVGKLLIKTNGSKHETYMKRKSWTFETKAPYVYSLSQSHHSKVETKETVIKVMARATTAWPSLIEADPPFSLDVAGVAGDFPAGASGVIVVALLVNTAASGELGEIPRSSVHSCTFQHSVI